MNIIGKVNMALVDFEGLRSALVPLMGERTPAVERLEELRQAGLLPVSRRKSSDGVTERYEPIRVLTVLAGPELLPGTPATRGIPLSELAPLLARSLGPGAPSLSTLRVWERSGKLMPIARARGGRALFDADAVMEGLKVARAGHFVTLRRAAEELHALLGAKAPVYHTLRRWEAANRIAPSTITPSGRRLYELRSLLACVAPADSAAAKTSSEDAEPAELDPPESQARASAQPADWATLESRLQALLTGVVTPIWDEFRQLSLTLQALGDALRDIPSPVTGDAASSEVTRLVAGVEGLLDVCDGFRKTVMARQDSEITTLKERIRSMEEQARAKPVFAGRSGTTY
jgi:hypothetical protein